MALKSIYEEPLKTNLRLDNRPFFIKMCQTKGATMFIKSLQGNSRFLGSGGGPTKIWLLQYHVVLWIHVIDAIFNA